MNSGHTSVHPLGRVLPNGDSAHVFSPTIIQLDGRTLPLGMWRKYVLVLAACTLSCTVTLKVGAIQYLEVIFAADLVLLAAVLIWNRLQLRVLPPFLQIAKSYGIFLLAAFVLSLFALQQDFPLQTSGLKAPVLVTLARMVELFLDAFYMLYLAAIFRDDEALCRFGIKTYFWTGIAGCLYCFATLPLNVLFEAQLGSYTVSHRFRGFNNEGGGFGVYLLSVIVLAGYMRHRGWLTRAQFWLAEAVLVVGFIGSQSKSGYVGLVMLWLISSASFLRGPSRWVLAAAVVAALAVLLSITNISEQFDQYRVGAQQYRELSNLKQGDANFVMGRTAGVVIAPRMIRARPLLGVGWGNYPLVRDDYEYRQGTAFIMGDLDAPSLGIIDYIVELGIPLWLYLTWIELKPVFMLHRKRADPWLVALALILPISNWAGAHLNLMHPWIVVAFALGLAYPRPNPPELIPAA